MGHLANLLSSNRRDTLHDKASLCIALCRNTLTDCSPLTDCSLFPTAQRSYLFWALASKRRTIGRLLAIKQSSTASEEILVWCRRYYLATACRRGTIRLIRNLKQR